MFPYGYRIGRQSLSTKGPVINNEMVIPVLRVVTLVGCFHFEETIMQDVTLVGIDLGKHSFHLHGQGRTGKAVLRMKLTRKQLVEFFVTFHTCVVVMEACAGAHHMARKLATFGYHVKLISPQFVRHFVKSNKNVFVDAEAICEAASRPTMRFVRHVATSRRTRPRPNCCAGIESSHWIRWACFCHLIIF
jgi:hypothetical protein